MIMFSLKIFSKATSIGVKLFLIMFDIKFCNKSASKWVSHHYFIDQNAVHVVPLPLVKISLRFKLIQCICCDIVKLIILSLSSNNFEVKDLCRLDQLDLYGVVNY